MKPLSAESLLRRGGDPIRAPDWNDLIDAHRRRRPAPGHIRAKVRPFMHPWKVTVEHSDETPRQWSVAVKPGVVNDQIPTIPYLRTGDPRGWIMPDDHPGRQDPKPQPQYVEREIIEVDDPPFLTIQAPLSPADLGDFVAVSDSARLDYFRTSEMWEKEIYRASVVLSATPYAATRSVYFPHLLPTTLRQFRIFAGRLPIRTDGVKAGDFVELARLFLVRTPGADLAVDDLVVQQKVFWCLGTAVIEPSLDLGQAFDLLGIPGLQELADLIAAGVNQDLASAAEVAFWTT